MEDTFNYTIYSNTLYIFESLVNEQKTGKWLYEDLLPFTYVDDIYEIHYTPIESRRQLFEELDKIKIQVKEQLRLPTIHLEAHGDEDGFEIAQTKEYITWQELNDQLGQINFLCQNNLILSLGICKGHYINLNMIKAFEEEKRCPYSVNISPIDNIGSNEIKLGFSQFYRYLFQNREFGGAMKNMQNITSLNFLLTSDMLAVKIIENVKKYSKRKDYAKETKKQLKKLKREGKLLLPERGLKKNLIKLKKYKREFYKAEMKKRWNYFLMIDAYESNKQKFQDFEKVWNEL